VSAVSPVITWKQLWIAASDAVGDTHHGRWICEEAGGFDTAEWLSVLDTPVGGRAVARVDAMVERRRAGEPIQYVLGAWAFRTVDLMLDRRVLIPRPETELVAETAIELAKPITPRVVVDLGTGSGAIALSCAAELGLWDTTIWATDASEDALNVARANLAGLGRAAGSVQLTQGSWFDALPDDLAGAIDVLISNPPYVADGDPEIERSVLDWEPPSALFAGPDGLDAIRVIVAGAPRWLKPGGWLVLEIDARQGVAVGALAEEAGLTSIEIRRDLAGRDRIAVAQRPERSQEVAAQEVDLQ
jgi:release factor glutamine methyltransferase